MKTDLPTFTADDFSSVYGPGERSNVADMVNRRLAEWKAGLTVVTGSKGKWNEPCWYSASPDTHKAYIFGVSEIKKSVGLDEVCEALKKYAPELVERIKSHGIG